MGKYGPRGSCMVIPQQGGATVDHFPLGAGDEGRRLEGEAERRAVLPSVVTRAHRPAGSLKYGGSHPRCVVSTAHSGTGRCSVDR